MNTGLSLITRLPVCVKPANAMRLPGPSLPAPEGLSLTPIAKSFGLPSRSYASNLACSSDTWPEIKNRCTWSRAFRAASCTVSICRSIRPRSASDNGSTANAGLASSGSGINRPGRCALMNRGVP